MNSMDPHQRVLAWRERLAAAEKASKEKKTGQAEVLYTQALDMARTGLEEQELITSLIHLADFYGARDQYPKAEDLYRQALEKYDRSFGNSNFISAICMRSLGEVLAAQGKVSEAQEVQAQAERILATIAIAHL